MKNKQKTQKQRIVPLSALLLAICAVVLAGCAGLAEKTGRLMDGSAFDEKIIEVYRNNGKDGDSVVLVQRKNGGRQLAISLQAAPNIRWYGSPPTDDGTFYFTGYTFFSSSENGWIEFTMDAAGSGTVVKDGGQVQIRLNTPLELIQISEGKILRGNTRITNGEAITALRNRRERINALTEWMREQADVPSFADQAEFTGYWLPVLLPELAPKKKRPPEWSAEDAEWSYAEDIRWNTNYTKLLFPEHLWALRNSGALLRDWEEAADWIYMEYQWETLMRPLYDGLRLTNGGDSIHNRML